MKKIYITPCCKTRSWRPIINLNISGSRVYCELCDKEHDFEDLLEVKNKFNPTTYFCDKCHKSLEEAYN
jgi:hypothetical protein